MNDRGTGQSCPKRRRDYAARAPYGMVPQAPRRVSTAILSIVTSLVMDGCQQQYPGHELGYVELESSRDLLPQGFLCPTPNLQGLNVTQAWAAPDRARVGPVSERGGPREEEAPSRGPVGLSTHASLSGIGTRAGAFLGRSRSLLKGDGRGLVSHGVRFRCSGRPESVTPTAS